MAGISSFLFGSPQKTQQLPLFSPQQQAARTGVLQSGQQQLQNNPLSFAPIKAQYEKQFNEQVIPGLAERFSAMGGQRSSAFPAERLNSSEDFYAKLAALESQYNLQANQQGLQQLQTGLTPQFENILHQRQPGFLENLGSTAAQGAGAYLTGGLGGGAGGLLSLLQQLFSGGQQTQAQPVSFQSQMQNAFRPSQGNAVGREQLMQLLQQILGGQ